MSSNYLTKLETVSDAIAKYMADIGISVIFGVISIHNMPILDAIARQNKIRFVPTRGEAGAINMADSYSRVSGNLGVCIHLQELPLVMPQGLN